MDGILRLSQQLPTDQRSWEQFLRRLNNEIKYDGSRAVINALATISERTGTDFDTLMSYLTDEGRAEDQRFLPQVSAGNKLSTQSQVALSATASATDATIDIAAHTVQYGYGLVSFNSGTISGLSTNTTYYVYADDPDYEGGAVSYFATTNPQTVTASNGRYYVGSITTPLSSTTANIADATSANPIVFETSASHGWSTGNTVEFASLPGDFGTNLNGQQKTITVVDGTHFSIAVDGSGYAAYTSGGTATRVTSGSTGGGGAGSGYGGGVIP